MSHRETRRGFGQATVLTRVSLVWIRSALPFCTALALAVPLFQAWPPPDGSGTGVKCRLRTDRDRSVPRNVSSTPLLTVRR